MTWTIVYIFPPLSVYIFLYFSKHTRHRTPFSFGVKILEEMYAFCLYCLNIFQRHFKAILIAELCTHLFVLFCCTFLCCLNTASLSVLLLAAMSPFGRESRTRHGCPPDILRMYSFDCLANSGFSGEESGQPVVSGFGPSTAANKMGMKGIQTNFIRKLFNLMEK